MSSLLRDSSWIIRDKATKRVVFETFNPKIAKAINTKKYEAIPALKYLQELNRSIRASNPHQRKGSHPRGKTPPHLKKYLFKKGHR